MNHVPCTQWRYVAMHSVFCVEKKITFTPVNCLIHTCYYWKFICCLCSLLKTFAPCGSNEKKNVFALFGCFPCLQRCAVPTRLLLAVFTISLFLVPVPLSHVASYCRDICTTGCPFFYFCSS